MRPQPKTTAQFVWGVTNRPELGEMFGGFYTEFLGKRILIDCGTVTGAKDLVQRLKSILGDKSLDFVFLTHIHLDHSGGLSAIFKAWPQAKAVVHEDAIRHLIYPAKLWRSTKRVMGEMAAVYGEPRSVDDERLIPHTAFSHPGIQVIETPGHAAHHLSYRLGLTLFCGEAVGCPYAWGANFHSRPATPPLYYPELTFHSLNLLLKEPAKEAYFAHTHERGPLMETILAYRRQLTFWDQFLFPKWSEMTPETDKKAYISQLTDELFEIDPELKPLLSLESQPLETEKYFMRNSVLGFFTHYDTRKAEEEGQKPPNFRV
ncbi:MAG: MBL fold metallo-hydrolase [Deltaproteobacteria bacterium]|jgi:glyoxylase-like metal-dependent hydrolase (beta-lactamase superfamily II)|nr:MBL fold metallo-hydrolase [Deltaproteobacteria bacterium]